ncbi:MAG: 2-amino-4-hydroxy-6-hydroxymethyldihydropteridi ne pyrophosphokinae [Pseudomonadota bacterium]
MNAGCAVAGAHRALIGLGANLPFDGQSPAATLRSALHALEATPGIRVLSCSSLWRSRPVRAQGPDFVNAAAEIESQLSPEPLLERLLEIEASFGRHRPSEKQATSPARTLDLDLLWMDNLSIDLPHLTLPHPRAASRAFVLAPLAELRPALRLQESPQAPTVEALLSQALRDDPGAVSRMTTVQSALDHVTAP